MRVCDIRLNTRLNFRHCSALFDLTWCFPCCMIIVISHSCYIKLQNTNVSSITPQVLKHLAMTLSLIVLTRISTGHIFQNIFSSSEEVHGFCPFCIVLDPMYSWSKLCWFSYLHFPLSRKCKFVESMINLLEYAPLQHVASLSLWV